MATQLPNLDGLDDDGAEHLVLTVRRELTQRRIDQYVQARVPRLSRSGVQKLIAAGAVAVNGQAETKASRKLSPGDVIDVIVPPPQPKEIPPEPIPINVVYEDDHLLAINKQAGVIVHPARGNPHGTLVNGLAYYADKLSAGSDPFRPGIVHRLDRDTTGVMLVAKTDEAHWRLARAFEDRRMHKTYLAVVHGRMELDADRIDAPLARHPKARENYAVAPNDPAARNAVTTYRVRTRFRGFTLMQLEPKTGRTHQLRVHMAHLRHPIVADGSYGGRKVTEADLADREPGPLGEPPLIARQALHAHAIRFDHPVSGEQMELAADPPEDFARLLGALEKYRSQ